MHDATHLDALWETADLIAGAEFELSPCEGFVLGGSFLIHDLGMGLAAWPGGIDELERHPGWADILASVFRRQHGRGPTQADLDDCPETVLREARGLALREMHAEHAAELATVCWTGTDGKSHFLIEDEALRNCFGGIIGEIAYSHWWPVEEIRRLPAHPIGAPPDFPDAWKVRARLLACLLRVADASHLDARRAPTFLRTIRRPRGVAALHWEFQELLHKVQASDDRLLYTSASRFPVERAGAWWVCFETLQMVDRELQSVDAFLADLHLPRFAARSVAGADHPMRLREYLPTDGWLPVDAEVRISDPSKLVRHLGGEALYGERPSVALRELLQNSLDAIRALRRKYDRDDTYGVVRVSMGEDENGHWIEVADNGIGMSSAVLSGPLVDFGTSYWGSALMRQEHPGLLASGFEAIGRFGIGFFSVFMLGDLVKVTSRRFEAAQDDTFVLEFGNGVSTRPILRPARADERLVEGGTSVRVWLRLDPEAPGGLLRRWDLQPLTLVRLCRYLAPSAEVRIIAQSRAGGEETAIEPNDWQTMPAAELFDRFVLRRARRLSLQPTVASNVRPLFMRERQVGRLTVVPTWLAVGINRHREYTSDFGCLTIGGLRSTNLRNIVGFLEGRAERAARDFGFPLVENDELARWATEQSPLVAQTFRRSLELAECAAVIRSCGGDIGDLPIGFTSSGWADPGTLPSVIEGEDSFILVISAPLECIDVEGLECRIVERNLYTDVKLSDNVVYLPYGYPLTLLDTRHAEEWPDLVDMSVIASLTNSNAKEWWASYGAGIAGLVVQIAAEAWQVAVVDILEAATLDRFDGSPDPVFDIGTVGAERFETVACRFARPTGTPILAS